MMKKIKLFILTMIFIFMLFIPRVMADSATINPLWTYYDSLSDTEKSKWNVIPNKYIYEYVSPSYKMFSSTFSTLDVLPSSYNLTNVTVNGETKKYITDVKNQKNTGLCWAFAANKAIESSLLMTGLSSQENPIVLSERQMDYAMTTPKSHTTFDGTENFNAFVENVNPYVTEVIDNPATETFYGDRRLAGGGNFEFISYLISNGISPVEDTGEWGIFSGESIDDSIVMSVKDVFDTNNVKYQISEYVDFPYIYPSASDEVKEEWINMIKKHIIEYGAAYLDTISPSNVTSGSCEYLTVNEDNTYYYDSLLHVRVNEELVGTNKNYYNCGKGYGLGGKLQLHAMALIGWDDNYHKEYCAFSDGTTSGDDEATCIANSGEYLVIDGAWILQNSWTPGEVGSKRYARQYPYLSYDSHINGIKGIKKIENKNYDKVYADLTPHVFESNNTTNTVIYERNENIQEKINRIAFKHSGQYEGFDVYISQDRGENWTYLDEVSVEFPGLISLDLSSDNIELISDNIAVKVVGTSSVSDIYAYSNYIDNDGEEKVKINVDTNIYYSDNYYLKFDVLSTNVEVGTKVSYKIFDENDNLMNEYFSVDSTYIINDNSTGIIKLLGGITKGYYTLKIYDESYNELGSEEFYFNSFEGYGNNDSPYKIYNADDLVKISSNKYYSDKNYILMSDIDLTTDTSLNGLYYNNGLGWKPICGSKTNCEYFSGIFDGNGKKINGLTMNREISSEDSNVGIFVSKGSTIKNLKITNVNINANVTDGDISIFYQDEDSKLENILITGIVSDGIMLSNAGNINNCLLLYDIIDEDITDNNAIITNNAIIDNTIVIIDVYDKENIISYSNKGIYINNTYTDKTIEELKNNSTYLNFDSFSNYWEYKSENVIPTLKNIPYIFVDNLEIIGAKNIMNVNEQVTLKVNISPSDAEIDDVSWISSDSNVLSVDSSGNVKGISNGTAKITVISKDKVQNSKSIDIKIIDGSIEISNIDNKNLFDKKSGLITFDIIPDNNELNDIQFIIRNSNNIDITDKFNIQKEDNNNSFSISLEYLANTITAGNYTVEVLSKNAESKFFDFVIDEYFNVTSLTLEEETLILKKGDSALLKYQLNPENATNKDVEWYSDNNEVVSVNNGNITAVNSGITKVYIKSKDDNSIFDSISITVLEPKIELGETIITSYNDYKNDNKIYIGYGGKYTTDIIKKDINSDLIINIYDSNNNEVSDSFVITEEDNKIIIELLKNCSIESGKYKVVLSDSNNYCSINYQLEFFDPIIIDEISITKSDLILYEGDSYQLSVNIKPNNATYMKLSYNSSNSEIVEVNSSGSLKAKKSGAATIYIKTTDGSNKLIEVNINVINLSFDNNIVPIDDYMYIDSSLSSEELNERIDTSGMTVDIVKNNEDFVGTGSKVIFSVNNKVFKTYTVIVLGDINGDGRISISDVSKLFSHVSKVNKFNEVFYVKAADVNGSSDLTISDVSKLFSFYTKAIPSL